MLQATYFTCDDLNRVESEKDALGQVQYYAYDANSNLIRSTDPEGDTTYFSFDALNRRTSVSYPDSTANYFQYDALANMTDAQDARGWSYFEHDALNRLTADRQPSGESVFQRYDGVGQRVQVVSAAGSPYYVYDAAGRMVRVDAIGALGYGIQPYGTSAYGGHPGYGTTYYEYDAASRLMKKLLANGSFTYFQHDAGNRVTSIKNCLSDGSALAYFEYGYDAASRVTHVRRENDDIIYYGYDDADRLTSETWKDSGGSSIYAFSWDYDAVGNRTYQKRGSDKTYYSYDGANALTQSHELPADTWTYYHYDRRGNCLDIQEPDGTTYFEYNHANLVSSIKYKDSVMNHFWYDAQQRRYAMQDSDGLSYFTWDQNGMNLLAERDSQANVTAEYTHGYTPMDGIGSMAAAKKTANGSTYYQYPIYDHRGTVVRLVDENGNTVGDYEYDAWGNSLHEQESGAPNRFRYQSNWITLKNSDRKLCLSPASMYDPGTGRFLQVHRLGSAKSGWPFSHTVTALADSNGASPSTLRRQILRKQQERDRRKYDAEGALHSILRKGSQVPKSYRQGVSLRRLRGCVSTDQAPPLASFEKCFDVAVCILGRLGMRLPRLAEMRSHADYVDLGPAETRHGITTYSKSFFWEEPVKTDINSHREKCGAQADGIASFTFTVGHEARRWEHVYCGYGFWLSPIVGQPSSLVFCYLLEASNYRDIDAYDSLHRSKQARRENTILRKVCCPCKGSKGSYVKEISKFDEDKLICKDPFTIALLAKCSPLKS